MGQNRFLKLSSLTLAVGLLLSLSFQNCTDVKLLRGLNVGSESFSSHNVSSTQLPAPIVKAQRMRVVIIVDQSFSMAFNKCVQDLDSTSQFSVNLQGDNTGCTPSPGVDPQRNRYKVIRQWINELVALQGSAPPGQSTPPIEVAVIPFSGGIFDRTISQNDLANTIFYLPDDPKLSDPTTGWIAKLEKEQIDEAANITADPKNLAIKMGTSAPHTSLSLAYARLNDEITKIAAAGSLANTNVDVIYMSDGVPRPLQAQYDRGLVLSVCPLASDCASDPNNPACSAYASISAGFGHPSPYDICSAYQSSFVNSFGDPVLNTYSSIKNDFQHFIDLQKQAAFKGLNLKLKLVQLNPQNTPIEDTLLGAVPAGSFVNIFSNIWLDLHLNQYVINGPNPPFSMIGAGNILTYQLAGLYAINLNAFINSQGALVVDSDGDGISDNDELSGAWGGVTDPANPRTNNVCLDGIAANYSCQTVGCDASLDLDGDSLNTCEELTLNTRSDLKDTDGDMILDGHEVLRGLDPTVNESKKSRANDGFSDLFHFFSGMLPTTLWASARPSDTIQLHVEQLPEFGLMTANGTTVGTVSSSSARYVISIGNIPIVKTLDTSNRGAPLWSPPSRAPANLPGGASTLFLGSTPHGPGVNQIVIVAKAQALQDPNNFYWLAKTFTIDYNHPNITPLNNVDFSSFTQIDFLSDGSPQ
jgi:hypothetical protein